ncbi:TlpA disulfide reductase family protein [Luteococcus peritonei]|uniref:TlpA family protein disulfide reductase n=1 Tax=Luteococcus peritonei TaxID=88874 RepID=A0ABW4RZI4_9ACTN
MSHSPNSASEQDWRARTRNSKGGSALVLLLTLALVLGGAWLMENRKQDKGTDASGGGAAAASVELSGDQTGSAPEIGQPAPDFTAMTMDGKKVRLSELKGHPVWITFGATWCTACRAEAPDIEQAWKGAQPKGTQILAVFIKEDAATVRTYANRLGLSFPMISDPETTIASRYRSIGIPSHFFIDSDGILRASYVGGLTAEKMDENLKLIGG